MTRHVLPVISLVLALVGCGTAHRDPATIRLDEALKVLTQAEHHARRRDLDALCRLSIQTRDTCASLVATAGGFDAVPAESPTVVHSYVVPDTKLNAGGIAHGGRVLILEGTNNFGQPYRMEYVVFDKGDNQLVSLVAPYWFNSGFTPVDADGWGQSPPEP